jgi:hypothetical protein
MMSRQSTRLDLHQFHPARGTFCAIGDYLGITIEAPTHSITLLDRDRRRLKDVSVSD